MTMATKLKRVVLYNKEWRTSMDKVTKSLDHVVLQGHVTNWICHVSTTTRPLAIKLGKMVSYYRGISPIKSGNPLNMWFFELTWQIEIILSGATKVISIVT